MLQLYFIDPNQIMCFNNPSCQLETEHQCPQMFTNKKKLFEVRTYIFTCQLEMII
jgi:hypothetical protein